MTDPVSDFDRNATINKNSSKQRPAEGNRRRRAVAIMVGVGAAAVLGITCTVWLGVKAHSINNELDAAANLVPALKEAIATDNPTAAVDTVDNIRLHTASARDSASDPLWTLVSAAPGVGPNLSAVTEVTRSADDVANLGLQPLAKVFSSLDWDSLLPTSSGTDLEPLKAASPSVSSAANAVRLSADRLDQIDDSRLLPAVAEPLTRARGQLREVTGALDAAASAAQIVPGMLGSEAPRHYLLMIQNNAEARASGGIPGALAVLSVEGGKLTLSDQSSAGEIGIMSPSVVIDQEQQQIYSGRLGKFMQDVNLTPDFPTAAGSAQAMWERKTGQRVDGVVSIDPVALSYILGATGSVKLSSPELVALAGGGLPTELTSKNVVQTLLSDVYAKIEQPKLQDAYFAGVAQEIFSALSKGSGDAKGLVAGITRAAQEGRVLVWSDQPTEQALISKYVLGGSIGGPSVSPAQFGVYFNDGTGAKMDYYMKRAVQLVKECPRDGYEETTVRITSTNTAPADAASSLPEYVTGDGDFGIPAGSVQTNLVVYGPAQANIETATMAGARTEFAPYFHSNRPVGTLAVRLAPGESKTVEFTFGKIVQHTEPNLVVTPTVQDVKDVILPTEIAHCG